MRCPIGPDDIGRRFDRLCRKLLPALGLGEIYSAIRKGTISVSGRKKPPSYKIREGDSIFFKERFEDHILVSGKKSAPDFPELEKCIIFENTHFIVFNKPAGVLSHGNNSVKSFLEYYLRETTVKSLAFVPAPLHRLDRNTSGILVCGKSIEGARRFSDLLAKKRIIKAYLSINTGVLGKDEIWEDTVERDKAAKTTYASREGKRAVMHAFPLLHSEEETLCLMVPLTGKTHQIRVQSSLHGYPLAGDKKYGGGTRKGPHTGQTNTYCLHACSMRTAGSIHLLGMPPLFAPPPPRFTEYAGRIFRWNTEKPFEDTLPDKINGKIASISTIS